MPSVRLGSAIFALATAVLGFLAYREYMGLVSYCEDSPEVASGGDKFSCLEPQHWFAEFAIFGFLGLLEIAAVVVLGVAVAHRRGTHREAEAQ